MLVDEATGTPGIKTVNLRFNAPFLENISASGYDTRVARSTGTLNIRTVAPAEYDHEIKRRPMTLREISDKNPQNMKKRGFFELSGKFDSDDGKITFVNVLTTDTGRLNTLDERIYSDHTVVAYGERNICINTTLGKRYREGSVETDALVFFRDKERICRIESTACFPEGNARNKCRQAGFYRIQERSDQNIFLLFIVEERNDV